MNDPAINRYSLVEMVQPLASRYVRTFFARADRFTQADLDAMVPGTTTLGDCGFIDRMNAAGCDNWTYRMVSPHRTDGMHGFVFTKPLTTLERNRPAIPGWWDEDMQPWDAELRDVDFIDDPNFAITVPYFDPDTGETGQMRRPRINVQDSFRDAESFLSPVYHELFISDKPFPAECNPYPQPTPVGSHSAVLNFDYPRCLHKEVIVPAQSLVYDVLIDGATSGIKVGSGALSDQIFPATNFTKRMPHVRLVEVKQLGVLWAKHRETVFPKDLSKLSTLAS